MTEMRRKIEGGMVMASILIVVLLWHVGHGLPIQGAVAITLAILAGLMLGFDDGQHP